MTEEEKKAIEWNINQLIDSYELRGCDWAKRILNMIKEGLQKQDTEINKLKAKIEEWRTAYQEEKDKQFDILQENIKLKEVIDNIKFINTNNKPHKAQSKIKGYFMKEQ